MVTPALYSGRMNDVRNPPSSLGTYAQLMNLPPAQQAPTYRHMDQLYPTRVIQRGAQVQALPQGKPMNLEVGSFMQRNHTAGLLVLHEGQCVMEHYAQGNTPETRWLSFSLAKSISSTLVGAALQDGYIQHLDEPVTHYVPALIGSAYDGVTLRQVLQMRSGVKWDENYTDPHSDCRHMLALQVAQVRHGVLDYMRGLPRLAPPGTVFNYSTGETYLVGEILRSAIAQPLSNYLSEKIWRTCGMESDAYWQLDAPDGQEFAGSGLSATLRDFGRFGQFILNNGRVANTQVLPVDWLAQATSSEPSSMTAPGKVKGYEPMGYGYQWWTFPVDDAALPNLDGGLFAALGIFGQQIYIHPQGRWVAVLHSTWPAPMDKACLQDTLAFLGDIHQRLCLSKVAEGSSQNKRL